jgi:hypothetical protein
MDLISLLYDASINRSKWSLFLEQLAMQMNGSSASLRLIDFDQNKQSFAATHGYREDLLEAYAEYYIDMDPYLPLLKNAPAGKIFISDEHTDEQSLKKNGSI